MSDIKPEAAERDTARATAPRPPTSRPAGPRSSSGELAGIGWVLYAGVMMILAGFFQIIEGLVSLLRPTIYVVGGDGMLIPFTYTTWGSLHLIIGIAGLVTGGGVLLLRNWARRTGIVLACVSAVANMVFIVASPVWPILVIVVDLLVLYALLVHGTRHFSTGPNARNVAD